MKPPFFFALLLLAQILHAVTAPPIRSDDGWLAADYDEKTKLLRVILYDADARPVKEYAKTVADIRIKRIGLRYVNYQYRVDYIDAKMFAGDGASILLDRDLHEIKVYPYTKEYVKTLDLRFEKEGYMSPVWIDYAEASFGADTFRLPSGTLYHMKKTMDAPIVSKTPQEHIICYTIHNEKFFAYKAKWKTDLGVSSWSGAEIFHADSSGVWLYIKNNKDKMLTHDYIFQLSAADGSVLNKIDLGNLGSQGISISKAFFDAEKSEINLVAGTFDRAENSSNARMMDILLIRLTSKGKIIQDQKLRMAELDPSGAPEGWDFSKTGIAVHDFRKTPSGQVILYVSNLVSSKDGIGGSSNNMTHVGFTRYVFNSDLSYVKHDHVRFSKYRDLRQLPVIATSPDGSFLVFTKTEYASEFSSKLQVVPYVVVFDGSLGASPVKQFPRYSFSDFPKWSADHNLFIDAKRKRILLQNTDNGIYPFDVFSIN